MSAFITALATRNSVLRRERLPRRRGCPCELVGRGVGRKAKSIMAGVTMSSVILGCGGGRMGCTVLCGITLGSGAVWVGGTLGSGAGCSFSIARVDVAVRGVAGGVTLGGGVTCDWECRRVASSGDVRCSGSMCMRVTTGVTLGSAAVGGRVW